MKKILLLWSLLCLIACNDDAPKPEQDISGNYNAEVHYLHKWAVSIDNHGTVLDTNYTSAFAITYDNDTLSVTYTAPDGNSVGDKLVYKSGATADSLYFYGAYNTYAYTISHLTFYKQTNRFKYTWSSTSNPSSGGNSKKYTINSQ